MERKAYPSDVRDDEWTFVAPFRRLARDDERQPATLAGVHALVFAILMLTRVVALMRQSA